MIVRCIVCKTHLDKVISNSKTSFYHIITY
nr:MAG TPA: Protein of unknown function (DUF2685) [Caudoviricetes sp.]DAP82578.1 MAG TPA: Protein of unknown function (DUF2685) [Caudoviricetes sp.]